MKNLVNFPTNSKKFQNISSAKSLDRTYVKLVVCRRSRYTGQNAFVTDLIADEITGCMSQGKHMTADEAERYHLPSARKRKPLCERSLSRPYMAAMVIGDTDWVGWDQETESFWECSFADLTDDGMALYEMLESIYPDCEIHILTFVRY